MDEYIVTVYNGKKEIPIKGLSTGEITDLTLYECRHIYPQDWKIFKQFFSKNVFDPEITYFLDMNFEIRIYKKRLKKKV